MATAPIRVLFVGDEQDVYLRARDLLQLAGKTDLVLEWTPSFDAALDAMKRNQHAAYLVDDHPGERSGLDVLRQAMKADCRAPIILLSDENDPRAEAAAMRAGAEDCVPREHMNAPLLEHSLRYAIRRGNVRNSVRHQMPSQAAAHGASSESATGREGLPTYEDAERDLVRRAIEVADGNKSEAARLLHITRKRLYRLIHKHGLQGSNAGQWATDAAVGIAGRSAESGGGT